MEFKPKDWVLVRDDEKEKWKLDIFSHFVDGASFPYNCVGSYYIECIPFEGNEHLLGTSDSPEEEPNEEFKFGDRVEGNINGMWVDAIFLYNDGSNSDPYKIATNMAGDIYWVEKKDVRHA